MSWCRDGLIRSARCWMWSRWLGTCCRRVGCSRSWPRTAASCSRMSCSLICSRAGGVARDVPGAAAVIAEQCSAHDYTQSGKPGIAWDDPDARARLVDALVGDAHRLLGHLPDAELDAKAAEAVGLLALVAGQDVEP